MLSDHLPTVRFLLGRRIPFRTGKWPNGLMNCLPAADTLTPDEKKIAVHFIILKVEKSISVFMFLWNIKMSDPIVNPSMNQTQDSWWFLELAGRYAAAATDHVWLCNWIVCHLAGWWFVIWMGFAWDRQPVCSAIRNRSLDGCCPLSVVQPII